MTNQLVGDVYLKIIEDVIKESRSEFEESGVSIATLNELQQEWQSKLSGRAVAQMPWDPKPVPPPVQQSPNPAASLPSAANGLPQYGQYGGPANGRPQIKSEHGGDGQYGGGLPNGYPQNMQVPQEGGLVRAQQLVQQHQAQQRGGLALPGQRPQGVQVPQNAQQQQYAQQQYMQQRQQQQALHQQQAQPRIKVENESPQLQQGGFQQQPQRQPQPHYAQTDGADDGMEQWQDLLAERRAISAEQNQQADRMMREQVQRQSSALQSGLMVPLDQQPKPLAGKRRRTEAGPSVPQLDGDVDDDDDDKKLLKDEEDEDAINSDLDSDDETAGAVTAEDDDDGDTILCTYDKVQRVKNKWKCTLKDGVMSVGGKEWVFHKGMGEFEW